MGRRVSESSYEEVRTAILDVLRNRSPLGWQALVASVLLRFPVNARPSVDEVYSAISQVVRSGDARDDGEKLTLGEDAR